MKTTKLLLVLLGISSGTIAAPHTFGQPVPGNQYIIHTKDLDSSQFNPGKPGEGKSWLMVEIPEETFTVEVDNAYNNKYFSHFTNADIVVSNGFTGNSKSNFGDEYFHFYSLDNGQMIKLGRVDVNNSTGEQQITDFSNHETKMDETLFYGYSFDDDWEASFTTPNSKETVFWSDANTSYEIDATGTMRVDGIVLDEVYRIKRERVYTERSAFRKSVDHKTITYEWWIPNIGMPIMSLEHVFDSIQSNHKYKAYYLDKSHYVITGQDDIANNDMEFNLYPNPAKDVVNVSIDIPQNDRLRISLLDMTGNVVETYSDMQVNAGQQTLNLPLNVRSGMYYIKMESLSGIKMKALMVN